MLRVEAPYLAQADEVWDVAYHCDVFGGGSFADRTERRCVDVIVGLDAVDAGFGEFGDCGLALVGG